jgi:hypothetical protein
MGAAPTPLVKSNDKARAKHRMMPLGQRLKVSWVSTRQLPGIGCTTLKIDKLHYWSKEKVSLHNT